LFISKLISYPSPSLLHCLLLALQTNKDGAIDIEEFTDLLVHLNLAPKKQASPPEKTDEIGSS
jgi:hypothetical protein